MADSPKHSKNISLGYRALRWCGLCALAVSAHASVTPDSLRPVEDQRHTKLETFFQSFGCPAPYHVKEYLGAADTYAIDYRLLPAISVLESTCGLYQRQNNRWGWASARQTLKLVIGPMTIARVPTINLGSIAKSMLPLRLPDYQRNLVVR